MKINQNTLKQLKFIIFEFLIIIIYFLLNYIILYYSFPIKEMILNISDNSDYSFWIVHPNCIPYPFKIEFFWLILAHFIYYYISNVILTIQIYTLICFFFISWGIYLISKFYIKNKGLRIFTGALFPIFAENYEFYGILRELIGIVFLVFFIYFFLKYYQNRKKYNYYKIFLVFLFIFIFFSHIFIIFILLLTSFAFANIYIINKAKDKKNMIFIIFVIIYFFIYIYKAIYPEIIPTTIFLSIFLSLDIIFVILYFKFKAKIKVIKLLAIFSFLIIGIFNILGMLNVIIDTSFINTQIFNFLNYLSKLYKLTTPVWGGGNVDGILVWIIVLIGFVYFIKKSDMKKISNIFIILLFLFPLILSFNDYFNICSCSYRYAEFITILLPIFLSYGIETLLIKNNKKIYAIILINLIIGILVIARYYTILDYYYYYQVYVLLMSPELVIINSELIIRFIEIIVFTIWAINISILCIKYLRKERNNQFKIKRVESIQEEKFINIFIKMIIIFSVLDYLEIFLFNQISFNWLKYYLNSLFIFNDITITIILYIFDIRLFILTIFLLYIIKNIFKIKKSVKIYITVLTIFVFFFPMNPYFEPVLLYFIAPSVLYSHILFGFRLIIYSLGIPVYISIDLFQDYLLIILPIGIYFFTPLLTLVILYIFNKIAKVEGKELKKLKLHYFVYYIIFNVLIMILVYLPKYLGTLLPITSLIFIIYPIIALIIFIIILRKMVQKMRVKKKS